MSREMITISRIKLIKKILEKQLRGWNIENCSLKCYKHKGNEELRDSIDMETIPKGSVVVRMTDQEIMKLDNFASYILRITAGII